MSLGLDIFELLAGVTNQIQRLSEDYAEGSDAWTALIGLVQKLDEIIDELVEGQAIEEDP